MRVFSFILILFFCFGFSDDPRKLIGNDIPSFSVVSTDSSIIDKDFFRSKVSLITFYSWTCLPCRHEVEALTKLSFDQDAKDFSLIIITDDNLSKIKKHFSTDSGSTKTLDQNKFRIDQSKIKIICDKRNSLYSTFSVRPTPATFLVDRKGVVRDFFLGFPTNPDHTKLVTKSLVEKIEKLKLE